MTEWIILSGFLLKTAGILDGHQSGKSSWSDEIPHEYVPHILDPSEISQHLLEFLKGMVRLLTSEHARMRDAAREQLGGDLDPDLFHHVAHEVFISTEAHLEHGRLHEVSDTITSHFDQTLPIQTQVLQRMTPASALSIFSCSHIEKHLLAAIYYSMQVQELVTGARLKLKIVRAGRAILDIRKQSASSLSSAFRNILAGYLQAFASEARHLQVPEKLRTELELASSLALAPCYEDLVIQAASDKTGQLPDGRLAYAHYEALQRLLAQCSRQGVSLPCGC